MNKIKLKKQKSVTLRERGEGEMKEEMEEES